MMCETGALMAMNDQLEGMFKELEHQAALLRTSLDNTQAEINQFKQQMEDDDRLLRLGQVMLLAERMLRHTHNFTGKRVY
jgi:hypothetical protein